MMKYDPNTQPATLAAYIKGLQAAGRLIFLREEAQAALGVGRGAFLDAAEKLQKRHQLFSPRPRHGFYVIIPPHYLNLGSPPPASFIDDLMRHEKRPYYVGLLKAAELHDSSHQAVMEFQVVTDKQMHEIRAGRSKIAFYFKRNIAAIAAGIEDRKTETGKMKVSSIELTLLDLLRYPQASGGIDNVYTIFGDLGPRLDAGKMASLSCAFEQSVVQRAGYLLDRAKLTEQADKLHILMEPRRQWAELDPSLRSDAESYPEILARDERWRVVVRRLPERDE